MTGRRPSRRIRPLSCDEARLWAHVAKDVTPLKGRGRPEPAAAEDDATLTHEAPDQAPAGDARSLTARPSLRDAVAKAAHPRHPPHASVHHAGPPKLADRRTRRGKREIDARLDLHGLSQIQARAALQRFLRRCRERGDGCVLVITGKGLRRERDDQPFDLFARPAPGVLRRALPAWLAEPDLRPWIMGYAEANPKHGGRGAFYVFLKRG